MKRLSEIKRMQGPAAETIGVRSPTAAICVGIRLRLVKPIVEFVA